jgi:hypothetical protein
MHPWRREKKIETLDDLLDAMTSTQWNIGVELLCDPRDWARPRLLEHHDCNYYVDTSAYDVAPEVAKEAVALRLVEGVPKMGYTSDREWKISAEGRRRGIEIKRERRRQYDLRCNAEKEIKANFDHDPGDEG